MSVLFLGIELSSDIQHRLSQYSPAQTRHIRPVSPELFHITLHYLGEVPKERVLASLNSHSSVQDIPGFDVRIHSLGAFGRKTQPAVLWAGVEPTMPFQRLHTALCPIVEDCGVEVDSRPYHPHITLARGRWQSRRTQEDDQSIVTFFDQSLEVMPLTVSSFVLFESKLTEQGRAYPVIQRYDLA